MPTYCFVHPKTKRIIEHVCMISERPEFIMMQGVKCERCLAAELASQGGQQPSTWPMKSNALAVHPSQRNEYMQFAERNGVSTEFDKRGRPVFRTAKHRKQYAELVGATDFDGGYSDPHSK